MCHEETSVHSAAVIIQYEWVLSAQKVHWGNTMCVAGLLYHNTYMYVTVLVNMSVD